MRSCDPASSSVVASTIIDANRSGAAVCVLGSEGETCLLSGSTITNGISIFGRGMSGNNTSATLDHNVITTNTTRNGGGIYNFGGTIQYNTICGNTGIDYGCTLYACGGIIQQ